MKTKALLEALAICLIPGVLLGQTTTTTRATMVVRGGGPTMDYRSFRGMLAKNPPALLVLFDTEEKEWEQEFERIRREDPFAILNLNFMPLAIYEGVGEELREKEGWQPRRPRWAIFGAAGKMIADGGVLPSAAQLADACAGANIVGKVETYKRFLREHPNHEEARGTMLHEMLDIAEVRTRYFLQVPEYRADGPQLVTEIDGVWTNNQDEDAPTANQIETLPELTSDADERIWGDYCAWFLRHLEGTLWQSGGSRRPHTPGYLAAEPIASEWARFSPMARAAYSKAAPKVEAALSRQPSSPALWGLWLTLHKAGAGKPMKDLLATLKPSPHVAPADWPPTSIRAPYLKLCRETGDWKAVRDLVEPTWTSMRESVSAANERGQLMKLGTISNFNAGDIYGFSQGFWLSNGEAYLEALLRQQRLSEAEQMMKTWASSYGWPGAFLSAAAIAERLGYESVAKSWKELGGKK